MSFRSVFFLLGPFSVAVCSPFMTGCGGAATAEPPTGSPTDPSPPATTSESGSPPTSEDGPPSAPEEPLSCSDAEALPDGLFRGTMTVTDSSTNTRDRQDQAEWRIAGNEVSMFFEGGGFSGVALERWSFTGPGKARIDGPTGKKFGDCVCASSSYACAFDNGAVVGTRTMTLTKSSLSFEEHGTLGEESYTKSGTLTKQPAT